MCLLCMCFIVLEKCYIVLEQQINILILYDNKSWKENNEQGSQFDQATGDIYDCGGRLPPVKFNSCLFVYKLIARLALQFSSGPYSASGWMMHWI